MNIITMQQQLALEVEVSLEVEMKLAQEVAEKNAELDAKNAELAAKNAELDAKNAELARKNDWLASKNMEIVQLKFLLLQSQRTDAIHIDEFPFHIHMEDLLQDVIHFDHVDVLRQAHAAGIDVINMDCEAEWSHLHFAANTKQAVKCIKYLMDNGADVKARVKIDDVAGDAIYNWNFAEKFSYIDPEDQEDLDLMFDTSFNALQIANLSFGRDTEVNRILRRKQYFREGLKAFHMSAIKKRIMTVFLCAKRTRDTLGRLPPELFKRVIRYTV